MASKMVTDRQKRARAVEATLEAHGAEAAAALTERLTPILDEGETLPEPALLQELLRRLLARRREALVEADEAHLDELGDGLKRRELRDEAFDALTRQVIETRALLDGAYGRGAATDLGGVDGPTARDPVSLVRQAERLVAHLTHPELETPEEVHSGVQVDPVALADDLRPPLEALRSALDAVATDRRDSERTLVAKADALAEFDATFPSIVTLVEGLFRLAGLDEYADRVRTQPPRRSSANGGSGEPADGGAGGDDAGGAAGNDGGGEDPGPETPAGDSAGGGVAGDTPAPTAGSGADAAPQPPGATASTP